MRRMNIWMDWMNRSALHFTSTLLSFSHILVYCIYMIYIYVFSSIIYRCIKVYIYESIHIPPSSAGKKPFRPHHDDWINRFMSEQVNNKKHIVTYHSAMQHDILHILDTIPPSSISPTILPSIHISGQSISHLIVSYSISSHHITSNRILTKSRSTTSSQPAMYVST